MRVIVLGNGAIKELVPTVEWHWAFSWRNWRIGFNVQESMWSFDFLWLEIWCDRYHRHGKTLNEIPQDADVLMARSSMAERAAVNR